MSLEVLYYCERNSIKRREDCVLCSIHCFLTSNGYKCIANGEVVIDVITIFTIFGSLSSYQGNKTCHTTQTLFSY